MIEHTIERNDSIPLIDEEFDAFSLDPMPDHERSALTGDEAWDDYPALLASSVF